MAVAPEHFLVVKRPIVTEKSVAQMAEQVYVFEVAPEANKHQIKSAIEAIWSVKVAGVRTVNTKGEQKRNRFGYYRTNGFRKAYVKLRQGYAIEVV